MTLASTAARLMILPFLLAPLALVHPGIGSPASAKGGANKSPVTKQRPVIDHDLGKLPVQVTEMRDAILAAARSGKIKELEIPIQWNELKPDFGSIDADKPVEEWKKVSVDGNGREILAILINILQMPYAVTRQGSDIENNKIYIWPYFAEVPLKGLNPIEETQLLRIVPPARFAAMKKADKYTYWRLVIGADGTWHEFAEIKPKP